MKERIEPKGGSHRLAEYKPTRFAYWTKIATEVVIAMAGIAITILIWNFDRSDARRSELAESRREVVRVQEASAKYTEERRIEILNTWLPRYLTEEGSEQAERMVIALDPVLAEIEFSGLQQKLGSAGLLDDDLASRLDGSVEAAIRARVSQPVPLIEAARFDERDRAQDFGDQLERDGYEGVEVRELDDQFVVVITGIANERFADVIRENLGPPKGPEFPAPASPTVGQTVDPPAADAEVPNIYNLPESEAVQTLQEKGFTKIAIWKVTSDSVGAGLVRQLVVDDGSTIGQETILVDRNGPTIRTIPTVTRLALKVSVGKG